MRAVGVLALLTTLVACTAGCGGGGDSSGPADLAPARDLALLSSCGHPGDVGNAKGVGKFCRAIADCTTAGLSTTLCSAIGNGVTPSADDSYFCTIYPCHVDAGTTECGENATCVCGTSGGGGGSGCACTPTSCH